MEKKTEDIKQIFVDIDRIVAEAGVTVAIARNEFINKLAEAVVIATPVDTGRLRASWFLSPTLSTAPGVVEAEVVKTKTAPLTLARLSGETEPISKLDGSIYLLNGANYAIFVEARRQFLAKVLARASAIAADVVVEIRNIKATGIP